MIMPKEIPIDQWSGSLEEDMLDVMNYYLFDGSLGQLIEGAESAVRLMNLHIPFVQAVQYRQQLGGIFTDKNQLLHIPGLTADVLGQLAFLLSGLDLDRLHTLAPRTTQHNHVEAYVNGPDCLQVLLEEIGNAVRYIHLSVMLFFNDRSGKQVGDALLQALARGVQVRVMVDFGVTAMGYEKKQGVGDFPLIAERLRAAGGQVINTFHTCYSDIDWPQRRLELAVQGISEGHLYAHDCVQKQITNGLNVVNHRKFMIIDGLTAVIGSLNIGDQYTFDTPLLQVESAQHYDDKKLGIPSEPEQWHDGCMRIKGAAAHPLNELFASQWAVLGGDVFNPSDDFYKPQIDMNFGEEECTMLICFPGNPVNLIQRYYLSLITHAADEAVIVNPYLIDHAFWEALQELGDEQSQRITLCNSLHVNDHPTNLAAVCSHMFGPFEKGVSFYDYSYTQRFSHWKISYDKHASCIFHGSYNMNDRSAYHDYEVGIMVKSKSFADKVKQMMDYDLSVSERITDSKAFFKHPSLHLSTYWNKLTENLM